MEAMFPLESMGETAENVAEQWNISREDQDAFAYESHQRAVKAQEEGFYDAEIVSVEIPSRKGDPVIVSRDEQPRKDTSMEKLATLKPAFRKGGSVTAGNSSSLNDGASAVVMVSERMLSKLGVEPMGRFVAGLSEGLSPRVMGVGPIYAVNKLLERTGKKISDVDLFELNEAFASQSLAVIGIGHPLGASGGRVVGTLLNQMKQGGAKRGIATMCIGVGQGIAAMFERD
jgi:acetyl-CoA acyltransferase